MLGGFYAVDIEPLKAPTLFSIGPLNITNAMLFALITAIFTVGLLIFAARYSQLHPKSKLSYTAETLLDAIWAQAIGTFGDRKTALKHLPLLATLFCFILVGNLTGSGLLPGVGTITAMHGGVKETLLRPFTTDLNATLSMAILTIVLVQFYSVKQLGPKNYFKHYFPSPIWHPMNLFIGINEVFGEILKVITLAMRLFGVIYAGEVLISAVGQIGGNFGWFTMIPTVFLEIFFSIVQAYVFMMLSATYIAVRIGVGDEHGGGHTEESSA